MWTNTQTNRCRIQQERKAILVLAECLLCTCPASKNDCISHESAIKLSVHNSFSRTSSNYIRGCCNLIHRVRRFTYNVCNCWQKGTCSCSLLGYSPRLCKLAEDIMLLTKCWTFTMYILQPLCVYCHWQNYCRVLS